MNDRKILWLDWTKHEDKFLESNDSRSVIFNRGSASTVQGFRDVTSKFLLTTVLAFFLKDLRILSILNCIEIYRHKARPPNLDKAF